jgi:hypothetical protein
LGRKRFRNVGFVSLASSHDRHGLSFPHRKGARR